MLCLNIKKASPLIKTTRLPHYKLYEAQDSWGGFIRLKINTKISKEEARLRKLFFAKYGQGRR